RTAMSAKRSIKLRTNRITNFIGASIVTAWIKIARLGPAIFSCSAVLGMICAFFKALTHARTNRRMNDKFSSRNL
ncbi:MAG: hypothetical protein WA366_13260, partial [Pseudolabrys sp.]